MRKKKQQYVLAKAYTKDTWWCMKHFSCVTPVNTSYVGLEKSIIILSWTCETKLPENFYWTWCIFVVISISWQLSACFFWNFSLQLNFLSCFEYFLRNFWMLWTELIFQPLLVHVWIQLHFQIFFSALLLDWLPLRLLVLLLHTMYYILYVLRAVGRYEIPWGGGK